MGQIVVRRVDDAVIEAVKARAKANHRSTEAEVRAILEEAVLTPPQPKRRSLLELVGAAPSGRTQKEIDDWVAHLRDEWDR